MSAPILLVTGGAGYIGSHVCKAAAAAGYLPVTFDNLQHGHESAVRWGPLEQGDLRDRGAVRAVLAKWRPQSVIHLAALISVGESVQNPDAYYETNVTATLGLLKEMRAAGILALAFSSSAAVYGEPERTPIDEAHSRQPLSPYGASKLMVEETLDRAGPRAWDCARFRCATSTPPAPIATARSARRTRWKPTSFRSPSKRWPARGRR